VENKRYHIIIASIVFAAMTWISVNLRYDYTVVRHIPVVLENMKDGKALRYPVPKYVTARFKGSGWLITGLDLTPGLKYFIDLSSIGPGNFVVTGRDLPEHVRLPFAVQLVDVKPDTLLLALDDYIEKKVPLIPRLVLEFHEGYGQVGATRIIPESTVIGGAREHIEQISAWHTEFRRFTDVRSNIEMDVPVEEPANFSLTTFETNVRLEVGVQPFAEKVFSGIPIEVNSPPSNREVIFIPPKMDIVVRGGIDQLSRLSNADFDATVNYETLLQNEPEYVIPSVTAPGEVKVVSRKPDRFKFIIRKKL
jgi:YbbR domain-containing protein